LATGLAVWLALRVAANPHARTAWLQLTAGGVVCLLLSQPAVFTLGGVAIALLVDRETRRSSDGRRRLAIAALSWATVFSMLYLLIYRSTASSAYMHAF